MWNGLTGNRNNLTAKLEKRQRKILCLFFFGIFDPFINLYRYNIQMWISAGCIAGITVPQNKIRINLTGGGGAV